MDILTRLGHWLAGSRMPPSTLQLRCATGVDGELPHQPEPAYGCGWFDSSLDLERGLAVIEHEGIDFGLALEAMLAPDGVLLQ